MRDLDKRALDRWLTRSQPDDDELTPEQLAQQADNEAYYQNLIDQQPDPCPECDWVGCHGEGCSRSAEEVAHGSATSGDDASSAVDRDRKVEP